MRIAAKLRAELSLESLRSPRWFAVFLWIAFLLELGLAFGAVLQDSFVPSFSLPTLSVFLLLVLWVQFLKTLGLVGSLFFGGVLLNSLLDFLVSLDQVWGQWTWMSMALVLVPFLHLVLLCAALLSWQKMNLKVRALFLGALALFLIRAVLMIPAYARWSGGISGFSEALLSKVGVSEVFKNSSEPRREFLATKLIGEKWDCTWRGDWVELSLSGPVVGGEQVFERMECGFSRNFAKLSSSELQIANKLERPVQLQFSLFDTDSESFVRTWSHVIYAGNTEKILDVGLQPQELLFVYAVGRPRDGVLTLASSEAQGLPERLRIELSPFAVVLPSR